MDAEAPHRAQSILEDFDEAHPTYAQFQEHFVHSRWDSFLALLSSEYPLSHTTPMPRRAYQRLQELRQERTALVSKLQRAVLFTLVTMGLAVFVWAFTPYVGSWEASILGAFVFSVCLCMDWPILAALWEQDAQG